jgi:hypothetical protein
MVGAQNKLYILFCPWLEQVDIKINGIMTVGVLILPCQLGLSATAKEYMLPTCIFTRRILPTTICREPEVIE